MRETLQLTVAQATPAAADVLLAQGIPAGRGVSGNIVRLLEQAMETYTSLAEPLGLWASIPAADFETVYAGDGDNEAETPLENIYPRASQLALFALTVGQAVSEEIRRLLADNEPALGYMLDVIASTGAERALAGFQAAWVEQQGKKLAGDVVLAYSPGYCGWRVTGQRALFIYLRPEQIGIRLNESCLMRPLKSISGVLVAGAPEIHEFENSYSFCGDCAEQECRQRIAGVFSSNPTNTGSGGR